MEDKTKTLKSTKLVINEKNSFDKHDIVMIMVEEKVINAITHPAFNEKCNWCGVKAHFNKLNNCWNCVSGKREEQKINLN